MDKDDEMCLKLRAGQSKAEAARSISTALKRSDWRGVSIGNKAIIQDAIDFLNAAETDWERGHLD